MGYAHIDNLYKNQTILLFRECYALEKIHGTSAHVSWKNGSISFFSGGEKHESFKALFDEASLMQSFVANGHDDVTVYGEAYGGKQQGMSHTYGKQLKFVAFDVKCGECFLDVLMAEQVTKKLGLEFVHYVRILTDVSLLDTERDAFSVQAVRNGVGSDKLREGVVLRPIHEMRCNNGDRVISKHKGAAFSERVNTPRVLNQDKSERLKKADDIAFEWVTDMRLSHVLDKIGNPKELDRIPEIISAMIEDVTREAAGEIEDSKDARRAIGNRTAKLFKDRICIIKETI